MPTCSVGSQWSFEKEWSKDTPKQMCEKQFSRPEVEAVPRFLHLRNNSFVTDDFQYYCIKLYLLEIRLWNTLRHLMAKKYFKGLNRETEFFFQDPQ